MQRFGLMRLGNCAMAFLGVFIGAIVELILILSLGDPLNAHPWTFANGIFISRYWGLLGALLPDYGAWMPNIVPITLAAIAAFLVTGAGNVLNDYYDRKLDKKAHPERPIPSGKVSPKAAWNFALVLFSIGLILTIMVNWLCFMIAVLNTILLFSYERRFKASGLSGNIIISYLTASVFLFGGASMLSFKFVPVLFLLALLSNVGREITKDIEDMDADAAFRRTLPITAGKKRAATIAIWFVLAAVILSFLPVLILLWDPNYFPKVVLYLPFVFVADAMFIYSCTFVRKDPRKAQSKMKDAMVIAMMAFLVTGFIGIIGPPMRL